MKKLIFLLLLTCSFSTLFAQGTFKYDRKVRFEFNANTEKFDLKETEYEEGFAKYPDQKNCTLYEVIDAKGKVPVYCYIETYYTDLGFKKERKVFCFFENNKMTAIGFMKQNSNTVYMYRIVN